MIPRRLFVKEFTSTSTDYTVAELLYTAPSGGPTMLTAMWVTASQAGTANQVRIHHVLPVGEETAASSNVILHTTASFRDKINEQAHAVKLVMQPGERLLAQLHSGTAAGLSGYGLEPRFA